MRPKERGTALVSIALIWAMATPTPGDGDQPFPAPNAPQEDVDQPPVILHQTKPRYPPAAFRNGIGGTVELKILIDKTGRVTNTRVIKSIPELDAAAIQCVMEWKFRPAKKAGQPVATVASAPVTFRIIKKK
jgi:protein TonB